MESVGVVIVSHSPKVAEGAADMVRQMVGEEVPLAWTGGNPSGGLGTDVGQRPAHAAPCFLVAWRVAWRFRPRSDPSESASRANERSSGLSRSGRSNIAM